MSLRDSWHLRLRNFELAGCVDAVCGGVVILRSQQAPAAGGKVRCGHFGISTQRRITDRRPLFAKGLFYGTGSWGRFSARPCPRRLRNAGEAA